MTLRWHPSPIYLIRERIFDLGDDFDITDESGRRVYHVDGKVLSARDRLVIEDPSGREWRRCIASW